jgi:hypothetical protein
MFAACADPARTPVAAQDALDRMRIELTPALFDSVRSVEALVNVCPAVNTISSPPTAAFHAAWSVVKVQPIEHTVIVAPVGVGTVGFSRTVGSCAFCENRGSASRKRDSLI